MRVIGYIDGMNFYEASKELRFESGSNFAIVHRWTPPWWFGFLVKTLLPRISSPPTSQSRQATDLSRVRLSVLQILGKLLELSSCVAPVGGLARPAGGFGVVLRHPLAVGVHDAEVVLCHEVAQVGSPAVPADRFAVVL